MNSSFSISHLPLLLTSFVQNKVADLWQGDASTLNQINQTTRSSNKQLTTTINISDLVTNWLTTIADTRAHPRSVAEFFSLFPNLDSQFTGGCKDERQGRCLSAQAVGIVDASISGWWRTILEVLTENGEQKGGCFTGTGLGWRAGSKGRGCWGKIQNLKYTSATN